MGDIYAGADWIQSSFKVKDMSPLGIAVADFLGDVFLGIYHMNVKSLRKVQWDEPDYIRVTLPAGSIATVDADVLTRIVVLAHDRMLRVDLAAIAHDYISLLFHQRHVREGAISQLCPTLEDHTKALREGYASRSPQEGAS